MRRRPRPGGAARAGQSSAVATVLPRTTYLVWLEVDSRIGGHARFTRMQVQGQRRRDDCEQALSGARAQTLARSREAKSATSPRSDAIDELAAQGVASVLLQSITTFVRSAGKIVVAGVREAAEPAAGAIRGRRLPLRLTRSAARSPQPSPHWARSNPGPCSFRSLAPPVSPPGHAGQPARACRSTPLHGSRGEIRPFESACPSVRPVRGRRPRT